MQRRKPPDGFVSWSDQTYHRLVAAPPEPLRSRLRVDHSTILNVLARQGDPVANLARLLRDNHETPTAQARLARRAITLGRSMLDTGVLVRRDEPGPDGRRIDLADGVADNFALNQPLAPFAIAALEVLDAASPAYALDVLSVVESVLEDPMPVLWRNGTARGELIARSRPTGSTTRSGWPASRTSPPYARWPELLEATLSIYRQSHPWVRADAPLPEVGRAGRSRTRDELPNSSTTTNSPAPGRRPALPERRIRTLRQTVPASAYTQDLHDVVAWLGETIRQTDSSLLEEWEALTDPDRVAAAAARAASGAPPVPQRPVTGNEQAFRVMVRNELWRRVELVAADAWEALGDLEAQIAALPEPPLEPLLTREDWDRACGRYYDDHDEVVLDADARGPDRLHIAGLDPGTAHLPAAPGARLWQVRQTVSDPDGDLDWVIEAECDLDSSDTVGEPVLLATAFRRL